MKYKEEKKDLFSVDDKYYLAHCISSDCKMGTGIAVKFNKTFKLRKELLKIEGWLRRHPICILRGKVFNLITKEKYWHKPTYDSVSASLMSMLMLCRKHNIKYVAMPKIACGLDGLEWDEISKIIRYIFKSEDIEILVCYV